MIASGHPPHAGQRVVSRISARWWLSLLIVHCSAAVFQRRRVLVVLPNIYYRVWKLQHRSRKRLRTYKKCSRKV